MWVTSEQARENRRKQWKYIDSLFGLKQSRPSFLLIDVPSVGPAKQLFPKKLPSVISKVL